MRSVEQSLLRLGTDRLDLLLIHDVDVWTHGADAIEDRFREAMAGAYVALDRLRGEGVVAGIGIGVNEAEMCVRFAQAGSFDTMLLAGRYSLLEQPALAHFLPLAQQQGIGVMLGGVFNSGILATGAVAGAKYNYQDAPPHILEKVTKIQRVCDAHGVALPTAALHFALGHPAVVSVVLGAQKPLGSRAQRGCARKQGAISALDRSEGSASARCGCARSAIGGRLMRIDAHHHLWTLARGDYGWLTPELAPIYRDFRLSDLAPHLAAAGIEGTILVQAAPTEAETMFLLDIAEHAEVVRGVVGWTDFDAADGVARIEALAARICWWGCGRWCRTSPMTIGCLARHWRPCWRRWPATAWYSTRWCCRAICRDCCAWSTAIPICNSCSIIAASRGLRPARSRLGNAISRCWPNIPTSSANCRGW